MTVVIYKGKLQRYTAQCGSLWFGYEPCDEHDEEEQVCRSEDVAKLEADLETANSLIMSMMEHARTVIALAEQLGVSEILNRATGDALATIDRITKAN